MLTICLKPLLEADSGIRASKTAAVNGLYAVGVGKAEGAICISGEVLTGSKASDKMGGLAAGHCER
jgi:hypothetical protein